MGTLVTIQVCRAGAEAAIERAFDWFREIESVCTRFDERSELMQLTTQAGEAVPVSAILFEAVRFALAVAEESGGAFDPTVGHQMEARGFNREHRSGAEMRSGILPGEPVSYRDVEVDSERRTIRLRRPLVLDLGAVAKGLAVDTAAHELEPFRDFAIDAGGDLYLGGLNPLGEPWSVGIRHPRMDGQLIDSVRVSNQAVCTSGDYERGAHIVGCAEVASATVIAANALAADALATAAFAMGAAAGIAFLERMGVDGLLVTPGLERYETRGLRVAT